MRHSPAHDTAGRVTAGFLFYADLDPARFTREEAFVLNYAELRPLFTPALAVEAECYPEGTAAAYQRAMVQYYRARVCRQMALGDDRGTAQGLLDVAEADRIEAEKAYFDDRAARAREDSRGLQGLPRA